MSSTGYARNVSELPSAGYAIEKRRKTLFGFAADDEINARKCGQRFQVDNRGLWSTQYDNKFGAGLLELACDTKRQRIGTAHRAQAQDVEIRSSQLRYCQCAKINLSVIEPIRPGAFKMQTIQVKDSWGDSTAFKYGC